VSFHSVAGKYILVPPAKVNRRHIKHGYPDENAGFIKIDRLLSVAPFFLYIINNKVNLI
jgi:hypothetical protein